MRNQFGGLFVILAQPRPIDSTSAEVLASIASPSKLQNLVWDFNGLSQNPLGYRYAFPKLSQDINNIRDKLTAAGERSRMSQRHRGPSIRSVPALAGRRRQALAERRIARAKSACNA
jgi:hypothetical protein